MSMAVASNGANASTGGMAERKFSGKEKPMEVRMSNITAGKGIKCIISSSNFLYLLNSGG